ncbi:hypothetical protein ACHAWC_001943 [Mediolabrus comicus]
MPQQRTLKPLLNVGDEVTAAWWPPSDNERDDAPSGWYTGVISSYKSVYPSNKSNNCYGAIRYYTVNFDDGDVGIDIPEHFVFLTREYELHTMKDDDDDEEWMGVKNVTDRHSDDPWAKLVGWYVATIDGEEHTFSLLSDALRAVDSIVVSEKGMKTKREDLNLPDDWDKLFSDKAKQKKKQKTEMEELKQRHLEEKEKLREEAEADKESAVKIAVVKEERKVREMQHTIKKELREQCKQDMEKLKREYEEEKKRQEIEEERAKKEKLKPRYQVGEEVYAAWWPDDKKKDEEPLWYLGRVKGYKDQRSSSKGVGEYGVVRLYKVQYADDGTEQDFIPEHFVMLKEDYLLSADEDPQHQWKGVKNVVSKDSDDIWASLIGYYVATIDGKEVAFPHLSEALRAYDASIVKRKGDKTKQADLNIPKDWDWLFPEIPSPPSVEELMKELQETKAKIKEQQVAFAKATSKKHDAEIEVAVKNALAEERKRTQDMKKRLRKELIDYHENEMKTTLEKFEEEKTKITKETMAKAQKKHEVALEKQRRDLEEHFQYEKDKAMQFVKLETKQHQKNEMQAEFNLLKKEIEREIEQKLRSEYSLPPAPKRAKVSLVLIPRPGLSPKPAMENGKENVPKGDSLLTPVATDKTEKQPTEDEVLV